MFLLLNSRSICPGRHTVVFFLCMQPGEPQGPWGPASSCAYFDNATEHVSHGQASKGCCCHFLKLREFTFAIPGSRFLYHNPARSQFVPKQLRDPPCLCKGQADPKVGPYKVAEQQARGLLIARRHLVKGVLCGLRGHVDLISTVSERYRHLQTASAMASACAMWRHLLNVSLVRSASASYGAQSLGSPKGAW